MSRGARGLLAVLAVGLLVAGVLLLRPGGNDGPAADRAGPAAAGAGAATNPAAPGPRGPGATTDPRPATPAERPPDAAAPRPVAGGDTPGDEPAASVPRLDREPPFPPGDADTTVVVTSTGSELAFRPAALALPEGTRVVIRYVNEGNLPHNLLLLRSRSDLDPVGIAALDAAETGFVPPAHADAILGFTPLAVPGETVEFALVVPPAGEYPYVCTFPGHYRSMRGTLTSLPR